MNYNMNEIIGECDILFITLDTLRYDVASSQYESGVLKTLGKYGPFEKRQTPGSFTYSAHHSFFAGFLPSPYEYVPLNEREYLFFMDNQIVNDFNVKNTFLFKEENFVKALENKGYRTICIGGVIFFSKINEVCRNLPNMFMESYWNPKFSVTNKDSADNQIEFALQKLKGIDKNERVFLFLNISAIHGPNYFYLDEYAKGEKPKGNHKGILGSSLDCVESQKKAFEYVDRSLGKLFDFMKNRNKTFCIVTSDHGTCYGEDGYEGHNLAHEIVWTVPYKHFYL